MPINTYAYLEARLGFRAKKGTPLVVLTITKRAMIVFGGVVEKKKGMILIRNKHVLKCPVMPISTEPGSRTINRNMKVQVISGL